MRHDSDVGLLDPRAECRNLTIALRLSTLTAPIPTDPAYSKQLVTIGDHIRKRRLDLGLLQREVGAQIGVCAATVTNWALGHSVPALR